ncbi:adenylosuccinate lyase [Candidatus Bathyarchaeota archaeon]|nr:adenylosuccinate lyase [Candidatus Bathyarchaeota archaeon]MDP6048439.1 adenylosuccinate lyase [Candidatus Bathyarchaeota archaeon]MDP7442922.1 adenylosuccinate lyase [Candidatus Bathyarchaeota archaeon]
MKVHPLVNPNILSQRYATREMNAIFSEEGKARYERDLWLAVLNAQKELGLEIPMEAIEAYQKAKAEIDLGLIKEIEMRTKHDVKAKIEAYNIVSGDYEYLHMGMTSRDLTDNVEQLQIKKAGRILLGKYVSVLQHLLDKADEYRHIGIAARTHHQAAQPTLLGRRFAMWAEELHSHLTNYEKYLDSYPLRGIKGAVGTQFDMANLMGSPEKASLLEEKVAKSLGFTEILNAPGQVYPRSLDYTLISHLVALASACESFAKTIRLMAGYELVTEGFKEGQVGSSVMPHKMNTRSTERICAFSHLLKMYSDGASRLAGDQWEEGDVSCSALRRVIIPDAYYASDGLVETALTVLNQMGIYPTIIEEELDRYLPFLATTSILGVALSHGMGREKAYNIIKTHAIAEALRMREQGTQKNKLVHSLAQDSDFKASGITADELNEILKDRTRFIGNAYNQIDAVKAKVQPLIQRHSTEAQYEPKDIL